MKLNERIYTLRTVKKLSQGDLADALGVSRQSISKWETGTAVPDIDHLVRLSEIFGVTLDELVKGEDIPKEETPPEKEAQTQGAGTTVVVYREWEPRKVAALVLLIAGFLCLFVALLGAGVLLLLAIPLFLCALVCVLFRRRVGLWCGWTVLLLVDVYLSLTTGILNYWWGYLRSMLQGMPVDGTGISVQIIVSIVMTLWEIGMIVATVLSYRQYRIGATVKNLVLVIAGWVGWIVIRAGSMLLSRAMLNAVVESTLPYGWIRMINLVYHLVSTFSIAPLLVFTVALIQGYRDGRRGEAVK